MAAWDDQEEWLGLEDGSRCPICLHLYPRMKRDPYVGGPIDPRKASFHRTRERLDEMSRAVAGLLSP